MSWNGKEKRRFIRASFPCRITIFTPQKHILTAHTSNIGLGGLRAILTEKLEISSKVNLELHIDSKPIICDGRIVWVTDKQPVVVGKPVKFFDTGIEFSDIKDTDTKKIENLVTIRISNE